MSLAVIAGFMIEETNNIHFTVFGVVGDITQQSAL